MSSAASSRRARSAGLTRRVTVVVDRVAFSSGLAFCKICKVDYHVGSDTRTAYAQKLWRLRPRSCGAPHAGPVETSASSTSAASERAVLRLPLVATAAGRGPKRRRPTAPGGSSASALRSAARWGWQSSGEPASSQRERARRSVRCAPPALAKRSETRSLTPLLGGVISSQTASYVSYPVRCTLATTHGRPRADVTLSPGSGGRWR